MLDDIVLLLTVEAVIRLDLARADGCVCLLDLVSVAALGFAESLGPGFYSLSVKFYPLIEIAVLSSSPTGVVAAACGVFSAVSLAAQEMAVMVISCSLYRFFCSLLLEGR